MTIDELIESFSFLDDWMEKYRLIMELGSSLPEMSDSLKVPENKVLGCQSQVWLVGEPRESDGAVTMEFVADSDAHIVRGLVAIALMIFSGKSPAEIAGTDPRPVFHELGLDQHLTEGRSNGLLSMVGRIKEIAAGYVG
jgi:cysteine desulfuration protein SufE